MSERRRSASPSSRPRTSDPLPVLIVVGIGELEATDWLAATMKRLGKAARGHYVVSDGSLAAELLSKGHRGMHQVYAPGEYWRPRPTRMTPASADWLRSKFRSGWLTHIGHDWSVESINATWVRFRYESFDTIVVHDGSLFGMRMTSRFTDANRSVIEVSAKKQQVWKHGKGGQ